MIRGLFIIVLSVVLSAATCIGIMMRYSHVSTSQVFDADKTTPATKDPGRATPTPKIVSVAGPTGGYSANQAASQSPTEGVPEASQTPGQFDYEKLSADLNALSQALQQFNQIITSEISRMKSKSAKSTAPVEGESS